MPFDGQAGKNNMTTPRLNNLRRIRKSLGLTMADAATSMGVATLTLQKWEKGYIKPQRNNWVRLCEVYRASMTQPKFAYSKHIPAHIDVNTYRVLKKTLDSVKREVVSDCTEQRIRIVKEYY